MVVTGDASPRLPKFVASFQLLDPYRCRDVSQIIFVAWANNFIIPGAFVRISIPRIQADTMQTHDSHAIGPLRILSRCHSSFARRDRLRCIEGKTGDVTDRSNFLALITGRKRMCRIFDDFQIVLFGDFQYLDPYCTAGPPICTGMIALVFEVIAASICLGSKFRVSGSQSTSTGLALK